MISKVLESGYYRCLKYLIIATPMGHLCGYVCIPSWHEDKDKDDSYFDDLYVHGGITFNQVISKKNYLFEKGFWIGFDCGHSGDAPDPKYMDEANKLSFERMKAFNIHEFGTIKDINFVRKEIHDLVVQLISVSEGILIIRDKESV